VKQIDRFSVFSNLVHTCSRAEELQDEELAQRLPRIRNRLIAAGKKAEARRRQGFRSELRRLYGHLFEEVAPFLELKRKGQSKLRLKRDLAYIAGNVPKALEYRSSALVENQAFFELRPGFRFVYPSLKNMMRSEDLPLRRSPRLVLRLEIYPARPFELE